MQIGMKINASYLGAPHEDICDDRRPLIVTGCGHYQKISGTPHHTYRPTGRTDYQLFYVASGKVYFYFDNKKYIVTKNNMVLFRPNVTQDYCYYPSDKPDVYWVHFTGSDVEQILDYHQIPKQRNVFYVGNASDFPWLYSQIIHELYLKRVAFEDSLSLRLQLIFTSINRYLQEKQYMGTDMITHIEHATHYFYENYNQNIVIEDYAKKFNLTPNWFIQCFKKITKATPMQYIISLRITNAMNLLDATDSSVSQIAEAVGYDNPLYFSRIFKRHTGMSPSEYRQSMRTSNTQIE